MCLIIFAHQCHPHYPLILLSNRDEFYERPTAPLQHWAECPELIAGRDLQAGGTWLGYHTSGRWAAITNYRDATPAISQRSRGELTLNFLQGRDTPQSYIESLSPLSQEYSGFNLLLSDEDSLSYISNRGAQQLNLPPGIYGLSNGLLDSPWPKSELSKLELEKWLNKNPGQNLDLEGLFLILASREHAADEQLPNTGIGLEAERYLSSRFIYTEGYGTRASTLLIKNQQQKIQIIERRFGVDSQQIGETITHSP